MLDYIISVISEKMLPKSIACGTSFLADLTNYWRMIDMEGFNMDTDILPGPTDMQTILTLELTGTQNRNFGFYHFINFMPSFVSISSDKRHSCVGGDHPRSVIIPSLAV